MGIARGLATGTQVGNAVIGAYRDGKLKAGLAKAGKFSTTEVADGEEAYSAGLKAKQARVAQLSVDDPEFAAKHKQIEDDFAPTMSALETNRGKAKSSMVQLPGGRRIEQDAAFSPEQMAGLRAEQASKVYSEQGYPEEAAKSTAMAQGIAKNRIGMQKDEQDLEKGALDIKEAKRKDKLHTRWNEEDDAYFSLNDPNLSLEERTNKVKFLASRIGSLVTEDEKKFPGVKFKGLSDDASEVILTNKDGEGRVPLTLDMLHQGYSEMAMRRDPAKYAEYKRKKLEFEETQQGLNSRHEAGLTSAASISSADNESRERVASGNNAATVEAARFRRGGSGGAAHLTPEQNEARLLEMDTIINSGLPQETISEKLNQLNMKYNIKSTHLKAGLSVGDLEKIEMMTNIPKKGETPEAGLARKRAHANSIHEGAGDKLYGGGEASPAAAGGPAPGTVRNGFRFKGGSPNDRNSWEAI